jgi:hypothetical protein
LKFLLDKSQGTQKLWIKRCKNMQSGHFRSFLWSSYSFWQSFFRFFCRRLLRPGHKLPHVWETEIDKIWVITGNGISIRFRSNINNAKVPMIVYLKSLIFIAILRGKLGKIYSQNLKRINFSIWVKENFRSSLGQLCYKFKSYVIVFGRHWRSEDREFQTLISVY